MKSMCNAIVTDVPVASSYISRSLRSWNGRFRLDGLLCTCHVPGIHDFHASELRTSFAGKCHTLHINRADSSFPAFLASSINVHCDNSSSRGDRGYATPVFTVMIPCYGAYSYDISLETHEDETTDVTWAWLMLHMQHITFKWRYHFDSDMHLCFILRMRYVHMYEHLMFYFIKFNLYLK